MEKRDLISSSMENMLLIYKDVGEFAKAIEQRMASLGYKAYGDACYYLGKLYCLVWL